MEGGYAGLTARPPGSENEAAVGPDGRAALATCRRGPGHTSLYLETAINTFREQPGVSPSHMPQWALAVQWMVARFGEGREATRRSKTPLWSLHTGTLERAPNQTDIPQFSKPTEQAR